MTDVTGNRHAPAPIVRKQWVKNGLAPKAEFQTKLNDLAAYAGYCRPKVVFIRGAEIEALPSSTTSDRNRWRFAWNSGPYVDTLYCTILMARRGTLLTTVPSVTLQIAKLADAVSMSWASAVCAEFTAQAPGGQIAFTDTPSNMGASTGRLHVPGDPLTPYTMSTDTMYVGKFVDEDRGRMVSACVWEASKQSASDYGFSASNVTAGSAIYAQQRDAVADLHRLLFTRGAAQLWNHCSETDATALIQLAAGDKTGTLSQSIGTFGLTATGTVDVTGTLSQSIGTFSLVASGTRVSSPPTFVSMGTTVFDYGTGTNSVSPSWGTTVAGDTGIFIVTESWDATAATPTLSASGVTYQYTQVTSTGSGRSYRISIYVGTAVGSDSAPTFDQSSAAASNGISARCLLIRGANGAHIIGSTATTTTLSCPGVFGGYSDDNRFIVNIVLAPLIASGDNLSGWTNSSVSGITERLDEALGFDVSDQLVGIATATQSTFADVTSTTFSSTQTYSQLVKATIVISAA